MVNPRLKRKRMTNDRSTRTRTGLTFATMLLLLVGCDSGPDSATLLANATAAQDRGDPRAAVIELKNLLQAEPEHREARWQLGSIYLQLGQGNAAVKELERAQRLGHTSEDLPVALLSARMMLGQFKEVLGTLSTMDGVRTNADLLVLRAQAQLGLRRIEDAERTFKTVLKLEPGNLQAQRGLARVALSNKDFEAANTHIASSLETARDDLQSWLLKGELELSRGQFADALSAFKAAELLLAQSPAVRIGLVRAYLGLGQTDAADGYLESLHTASPNHPLINYFRGVSARQRNDLVKAQEALREVLRVQPNHAQTLLLMGSIHYGNGEYRQAEDMLSRFVNSVPGHVAARKLLAAVHLRLNNAAEAINTLEPAVLGSPKDAQLLAMLGSAYLGDREYEKGSALLEKAAEIDPNAAAIRTQLALSHLASGAPDEAVAALKSAVELDPSFTRADLLLVFTHLRNRAWKEAETAARELAEKQPDDPVPLNLLGAALAGQGQFAQARQQYEAALKADANYVNAHMNLASLDARTGDIEAAQKRYQDVLISAPEHEQATMGLARLLAQRDELEGAISLLEGLRARSGQAIQARTALANIYIRQGKTSNALTAAEEASRLAPNAPGVMLVLGQSLAAAGEQRRALTVFEQLARAQSRSADAQHQLALAQIRVNEYSDAIEQLQLALKINPEHFAARTALGNVQVRLGETDAALTTANDVEQRFPTSPAGAALRGDVYLRAGDARKAYAAYQKAFDVAPVSAMLLKLYGAQTRSGDPDGAKTLLEDWLTRNPDDAAVRLTIASLEHQQGQIETAAAEYERVLKSNPRSVMALNNLAWIYFERNDPKALELAERAFALAPNRPEIADTRGWLLVQSGEIESGLKYLERAAKAAPQLPEIQFHLASGLAKAGDKYRARGILETILASDTDFSKRADAKKLLATL